MKRAQGQFARKERGATDRRFQCAPSILRAFLNRREQNGTEMNRTSNPLRKVGESELRRLQPTGFISRMQGLQNPNPPKNLDEAGTRRRGLLRRFGKARKYATGSASAPWWLVNGYNTIARSLIRCNCN